MHLAEAPPQLRVSGPSESETAISGDSGLIGTLLSVLNLFHLYRLRVPIFQNCREVQFLAIRDRLGITLPMVRLNECYAASI